jgi:hypothetical protein
MLRKWRLEASGSHKPDVVEGGLSHGDTLSGTMSPDGDDMLCKSGLDQASARSCGMRGSLQPNQGWESSFVITSLDRSLMTTI